MIFIRLNIRPQSKILLTVGLIILALLPVGITFSLLLLGAIIVTASLRKKLRKLGSYLSALGLLLPIIFTVNLFFYASGEALYKFDLVLFSLAVTPAGLLKSSLICLRLLSVASVAALFVVTTSVEEFEYGLRRLGFPWKLAFLFSLTLKLLPEMKGKYRKIEEAQMGRGVPRGGKPWSKVKRKLPILIPFLASVARYGFNLSQVLEARNFSSERTCLWDLEYGEEEYLI